jgi:peptidyl-prolyl cis-trans isomerase A (cyclophilin A)
MRTCVIVAPLALVASLMLVRCRTVPEPDYIQQEDKPAAASTNGDPKHGVFTLADATKDLPGNAPIWASIDTSGGMIACRLYDDKAPNTVANFIGLSRGTRPWLDPFSNKWVQKPAYDGTTFHRIVKGFMIQGGDAKGNGSGEAGYVVKDEIWTGSKHDRAGLLCMANRGPNTNSAQFFITDAAAAHLDGGYTIFGECSPESTIHAIAATPVRGETPVTKVVINSITISRTQPTMDAGAPAQQADAAAPKPKTDAGK